jgi:hypothetical protein
VAGIRCAALGGHEIVRRIERRTSNVQRPTSNGKGSSNEKGSIGGRNERKTLNVEHRTSNVQRRMERRRQTRKDQSGEGTRGKH